MTEGQQRLEALKQKLLASAGPDGAPRPGEGYHIVFLGDSITSTEWVHPNWREIVEYVLKQELGSLGSGEFGWKLAEWGIRCFNSGFDGATLKDMYERLETDVILHKPELVIVCGGDNDMHLGRSSAECATTLKEMLDALVHRVPGLIYMSPPSGPPERVADEVALVEYMKPSIALFPIKDIQYVDLFSLYQQYPLSRCYTFISEEGNPYAGIEPGGIDWLHPNQLGNAYIAKIVLEHGFGITFAPELYIKENNECKMFPSY